MPNIDLSILNQRQTPAFYADVFANRPAAGFVGRIFISTNTFAFYRDNGTGWDLIGGPGTGTITGSGTVGTVPLWNGASTIGDSSLIETSTALQTTKQLNVNNFIVSNTEVVTQKNSIAGGSVWFGLKNGSSVNRWNIGAAEVEAGANSGFDFNLWRYNDAGTNLGFVFRANRATGNVDFSNNITATAIIKSGGTSLQFLKADGSVDSNTYNTGSGAAGQVSYFNGTNSITGSNDLFWDSINGHLGVNTNVPGTALDVHHDQPTVAILNQTVATNDVRIGFQNNGVGLWRIGAFYNAGANDFGIYDAVAAIQPVTVKKTTGQVLIGTSTVGSGKLVVASATGDNGIQIVGATAPSLRIDNAESGPTKRAGLGISTAVNNFIQGSADRDFCMFNGSTTASPILFGIYGTTNVQEAARISAARNFLLGTSTDAGQRLQVSGDLAVNTGTGATFRATVDSTNRVEIGNFSAGSGYRETTLASSVIRLSTGSAGSGSATTRLTIGETGAATFSGSVSVNGLSTSANYQLGASGRAYFSGLNDKGIFISDSNSPSYVSLVGLNSAISSYNNVELRASGTDGQLYLTTSGNVVVCSTTDNGGAKLQINGSINGASVYATSGFVNETQTISTQALVYSFNKDQAGSLGSSSTTFNITGLPNVDGTIAYIYSRSSNTAPGFNVGVTIQINGNTVFSASTQNVTKTASFAVYRQNGSWVTIDGGTGGQLTYP